MNCFETSLVAPGRSPELPEQADLYGDLIGRWELDMLRYRTDVSSLQMKADVCFAWILDGRAVQDTWIARPHGAHCEGVPRMYGTTLRVWDSSNDSWRVTWMDVLSGRRDELVARRVGDEIVQIGRHGDGTPIRWIFRDMTGDSFRWTGEALQSDGTSWTLEGEFVARRMR